MASLICNSRSGFYYAQFCDRRKYPTRKIISLGTRKRRIAEKAFSKLEDAVYLGDVDPWKTIEAPIITLNKLGESVDDYLRSCDHLKDSTRRTYKEILRPFTQHVGPATKIRNVTGANIKAWLDSTRARDVTRKKYLNHLGYLFRYLIRNGALDTDPTTEVRLKKLPQTAPKAMTVEQVHLLVDVIRSHSEKFSRHSSYKRFNWLVNLVLANVHLGLRRGELINLKWDHVDLERRVLVVRNTDDFTTKTSTERALPICDTAHTAFENLSMLRNGDFVFHDSGQRFKPRTLTIIFQKFRRKAGLPEHINLHSTRHTFATWLAEKGIPITVIQSLMGHSSVTTTERYMSTRADIAESWVKKAFDGSF